jgi:hypothetical protein
MKNLKNIFTLFLIILITSCSNDDGDSSTDGETNSNKVVVVGREYKEDFFVPVIWENGEKKYLPSVAETDVDDLKVAVHNNDVYVVGIEDNLNTKRNIVLWKNGIQSRFYESAGYVNIDQLIVDNGNVYVLGTEYIIGFPEKYKYWKNGVPTAIINTSVLVSDDYEENYISKMVVSNNDVYCIGYEWNTTGTTQTGKYWKNAVPTDIAVFKDDIFDTMQDIQVNGNEVSILFNQRNPTTLRQETKLWKGNVVSVLATGSSEFFAAGMVIKDGVEHILIEEEISETKTKLLYLKDRVKTEITDGSFDVSRSYIKVDAGNVCIAYYTDLIFTNTSKYWLNGETTTLNGYNLEPFDTFFLAGSNVYMTNRESENPLLWVNGKETALPNSNSNFTAVFDVFVSQ